VTPHWQSGCDTYCDQAPTTRAGQRESACKGGMRLLLDLTSYGFVSTRCDRGAWHRGRWRADPPYRAGPVSFPDRSHRDGCSSPHTAGYAGFVSQARFTRTSRSSMTFTKCSRLRPEPVNRPCAHPARRPRGIVLRASFGPATLCLECEQDELRTTAFLRSRLAGTTTTLDVQPSSGEPRPLPPTLLLAEVVGNAPGVSRAHTPAA